MKFIAFSIVVFLFGVFLGYMIPSTNIFRNLEKGVKVPKNSIVLTESKFDSMTILMEKEKQMDNMKKTLIICYDLSEYEAIYYSFIFKYFSDKYNIKEWEIYPALLRIESNFKTTHVSKKGAKGLSQVLETTGEEVSKKIGVKYVKNETLWNEFLNISIGLTYLSEGISNSGMEEGIKRYLGGPAYKKSILKSDTLSTYVFEYKSSVWKEYERLQYIYKGVQYENAVFGDKGER